MYYVEVFAAMYQEGIRYLIVGGMALNIYGIPRMTSDLDLMIDLEEENIKKLVFTLKKLGYTPRAPVQMEELIDKEKRKKWHKEKNMIMFTFYNKEQPYKEIDIFLINPIDFKHLYQNKRVIPFEDIEIYLPSLEGLINLKKKAGRSQDICDIEALVKLQEILVEEELYNGKI